MPRVYKSKTLYKVFCRGFDGSLMGPVSNKPYYGKEGQYLTSKNAKGFTCVPVEGKLNVCVNGYHACIANRVPHFYRPNMYIYKVKLLNCSYLDTPYLGKKWVGSSLVILKRVYITELPKKAAQKIRAWWGTGDDPEAS